MARNGYYSPYTALYYEQKKDVSLNLSSDTDDDQAEDDDYFSVAPVEIDEEDKEDHTYCEKNPDGSAEDELLQSEEDKEDHTYCEKPDVSGAASSEKQTPDDTLKKSGP